MTTRIANLALIQVGLLLAIVAVASTNGEHIMSFWVAAAGIAQCARAWLCHLDATSDHQIESHNSVLTDIAAIVLATIGTLACMPGGTIGFIVWMLFAAYLAITVYNRSSIKTKEAQLA